MEATPHPQVAIEISPERVAGARFARTGSLHGFAIENLPAGALVPSAVETNMANAAAVKSAVSSVCTRLGAKDEDVALLLPDPVIRVFVQHFDDFPRTSEEAIPMLRWKLKKSVPFEVDETLLSYMRQAPRADGVDVVTAIARLRIIREYEAARGTGGVAPGSGAERHAGGDLYSGRSTPHAAGKSFGNRADHGDCSPRRAGGLPLHGAADTCRIGDAADAAGGDFSAGGVLPGYLAGRDSGGARCRARQNDCRSL